MSKFWLFLFIHLLQPKTVNAFQRVKLEDVKFADERFQDNSYWAKVLYCFCWSCIQVLRDFSMPQLTFFWPIYLLEWCRNWLWCEGSRDPWSSQRKVGTSCSLWFSFWEHLLDNAFLSDSVFIHLSSCRGFRHEKTKKKRGTYRGGQIDLQTHSIKFDNSDDEWLLRFTKDGRSLLHLAVNHFYGHYLISLAGWKKFGGGVVLRW